LKLKNHTHATSIVVTHDRDLAVAIADRVAMISEGRIIFIGTAEEIERSADPRIQQFIHAALTRPKTH
jgi:phospholipid/cholesterol/gamma-HCH transport system ATP-binding protein